MIIANYVAPQTVTSAAEILAQTPGARALAGGNSLLVEPSRSTLGNATLVSLQNIDGLRGINSAEGSLRIGAMTPLAEIAAAAAVQTAAPALVEAIASVGDPQVRHRATLGGNLGENDPGGDLLPVLIALGAQLAVQGPSGTRSVAAADLSTGTGQTSLVAGEIITAVNVPAPAARSGAAYEKFKHAASLYAVCGAAASVTLGPDGNVSACTVGLTGAAIAVTALPGVAAAVLGKPPTSATFAAAARESGTGLEFRGDHYASAEYRAHLAQVLVSRALEGAARRANA